MIINDPHLLFLILFLFFVIMIFYTFGAGSIEGFIEEDIPTGGALGPGYIPILKKNTNGTNYTDSAGNLVYKRVRVPQGSYAVVVKDSAGVEKFLEGSTTYKEYEIKRVPYGYIASPDQMSIIPSTQSSQYSKYQQSLDSNNDVGVFTGTMTEERTYNPTDVAGGAYHSTPGDNLGKYYFFDSEGKLVYSDVSGSNVAPIIYYVPGSYKYGVSNYVPNYEDSVYMSRTTRQSTVTPVFNTSSILGGFCAQHKGNSLKIEEKCNALDVAACASTSCCVLLGGQKCVAGSDRGPTNPANYSDFSVVNKDVYYYQGKCYGNCL